MQSPPPEEYRQLKERVAELEHLLADLKHERSWDTLAAEFVQRMDSGLFIWRLDRPNDPGSLVAVDGNAAGKRYLGVDLREHRGQPIHHIFPGALESGMPQRFTDIIMSRKPSNLGEQAYKDETLEGVFTIHAIPLDEQHLAVMFENITEQKQAREALLQSQIQEEQIRAQQEALDELSTPLIPIMNDVVVMPLVGTIDTRRAQRVMETLLQGVVNLRAKSIIMDITGVPVVDSQVANVLISAAQAVQLLGAQTIITGIRPEVAQTLVMLGVDLRSIITYGTLQSAVAQAIHHE